MSSQYYTDSDPTVLQSEPLFVVFGIKSYYSDSSDQSTTIEMEDIAALSDHESANMLRDIIAKYDTIYENVGIRTIKSFDKAPVLEPFYVVSSHGDGSVYIESTCVFTDTEPMLREEEDYFEALVYPEDIDSMIDYASKWHQKLFRKTPEIIDNSSPSMGDFLE